MPEMVPTKDKQTVTADWQPVTPQIDGVVIKRLPPIEDERGEICEVYRPSWGLHDAPLVYLYQSIIRPGRVKGWIVHRKQDDRIFLSRGAVRFGLYDDRRRPRTPRGHRYQPAASSKANGIRSFFSGRRYLSGSA